MLFSAYFSHTDLPDPCPRRFLAFHAILEESNSRRLDEIRCHHHQNDWVGYIVADDPGNTKNNCTVQLICRR